MFFWFDISAHKSLLTAGDESGRAELSRTFVVLVAEL